MSEKIREAKKARSSGDFQRAGDLYMMAGDEKSAVNCYLEGKHYAMAARLLERAENIRGAAQVYAQAENFEKSAQLYVQLKDYERASGMFEKFGDLSRASEMAEKTGNLQRAAQMADQAEKWERAAALYVKIQNYARAADIYYHVMNELLRDKEDAHLQSVWERARKYASAAGSLYHRLGVFDKAALCFEKAENKGKAAECYREIQQYQRAAELFAEAEDFANSSLMYEKVNKFAKALEMAEKSKDFLRAAAVAEKAGQVQKAASYYAQGDNSEKAADLYFQLLMQTKSDQAAGKLLDSQRVTMPKYAAAAGTLYQKMGNHTKAAWCYEQAGQFSKAAELYEQIQNLAKAGEMQLRAKNYEKAYETLMNAGDVPNKEILGDVLFHVNKFQDAGDVYVIAGQPAKAAAAYEQANNLYKASVLYEEVKEYAKAAELYVRLDEHRKAAELFEKGKSYAEAAREYEHIGNLDKAIACHLQTGKKLRAAQLMTQKGDVQRAIKLLQDIPHDDEQYAEVCLPLGEMFLQVGMDSLAAQKLKEALGNEPVSRETLEAQYSLAKAYQNLGKFQQAIGIFEQIVAVHFGYKDVLERLESIKLPAEPQHAENAARLSASSVRKIVDGFRQREPETPISEALQSDASATHELPIPMKGKMIREYEIQAVLGQGGMGTVYRARHIYLHKDRAIKLIEKKLTNPAYADRFIREARILSDLHHPNLVQLYEFGLLEEGTFFMVLELIQGESIRERIQRIQKIPVQDSIRIMREAGMGLQSAHEKGIIHRDLSPDNVMIVKNPSGNEITKVIDFGIAKTLLEGMPRYTTDGMFMGKPEFASPEQCGFLNDDESIDHRSDIYSLAITFYNMLTGHTPFTSPNLQGYLIKHVTQEPKSLAEMGFPEGLSRVVSKALSKKREDRQASMAEFVRDLDQL